jgi:hypothetical protein
METKKTIDEYEIKEKGFMESLKNNEFIKEIKFQSK